MSPKTKKNKTIPFPEQGSHAAFSYRADIARENNVIGSRIAEARKMAGMKQSDLSEKLLHYGVDINPQALSKWEKGNVMPNAYQLLAVSYALGIGNPLEFFTGTAPAVAQELNKKGLAVLDEFKRFLVASGKYEIHQTVQNGQNILEIETREFPVGDLPLSAGTGSYIDESKFEKMDFPVDMIPDDADFALRVTGDSMEPAFHNGQYVFIEKCEELSPGEVGAFILGDQAYIKVFGQRMPDENDVEEFMDSYGVVHPQRMLISYNKTYEPIVVKPSERLVIVGRVLK